MRKAIFTKFLGPTNRRGSRYKAAGHDGAGGSITIPADDGFNDASNHAAAAEALARKLGWSGVWVAGGCDWPGGRGFVYVNVGDALPGARLGAHCPGDGFAIERPSPAATND